jgi:hypothetical protein
MYSVGYAVAFHSGNSVAVLVEFTGRGSVSLSLSEFPQFLLLIFILLIGSPRLEVFYSPNHAAHYHFLALQFRSFICDLALGWVRSKEVISLTTNPHAIKRAFRGALVGRQVAPTSTFPRTSCYYFC